MVQRQRTILPWQIRVSFATCTYSKGEHVFWGIQILVKNLLSNRKIGVNASVKVKHCVLVALIFVVGIISLLREPLLQVLQVSSFVFNSLL